MFEEKIENTIHIITGDKENFYPMFKNPTKSLNFNTEGFDFVGVEGTYVAREQPQGNRYPLELYFDNKQKETDIDRFEISARNKGQWIIEHPYYGRFSCQPLSLNFETYVDGMTKVTGEVWETIELQKPTQKLNVKGKMYEIKKDCYARSAYTVAPTIDSISKANSLLDNFRINYSKLPATSEQAQILKSQIRAVSGAIQDIIEYPITFIETTQDLIEFPFIIVDNTKNKIYQLRKTLNSFIEFIDLAIFQGVASSILAAAFDLSINGNYQKRSDIDNVVSQLTEMKNSVNSVYENNIIEQDADLAFQLDLMYNITVGNLYLIALGKEQERTEILEKDSSIITLAHKFYGFSDDSIDRFINDNNLSIDELLLIRKGKKITWFV